MQTFEKLYMREDAKTLCVRLHKHFQDTKLKDERFTKNMLNATMSIATTISKGYEINISQVHAYLLEAKGFCGITKTMAYLGKDLGYFDQEAMEHVLNNASKMAAGLYKFMHSKKPKEKKD